MNIRTPIAFIIIGLASSSGCTTTNGKTKHKAVFVPSEISLQQNGLVYKEDFTHVEGFWDEMWMPKDESSMQNDSGRFQLKAQKKDLSG